MGYEKEQSAYRVSKRKKAQCRRQPKVRKASCRMDKKEKQQGLEQAPEIYN
jgi:hypothetical protein